MTNRLLLEPGGDALLVEPGSYLLYEAEFIIEPPEKRNLFVFPAMRSLPVSLREGIWVPPRRLGATS